MILVGIPSTFPLHNLLLFYVCLGDGGVETAEEAVEPAEPDINELCTDMFDKMSVFLQGELTGIHILCRHNGPDSSIRS